jgi:Xaa-Pro aminopeptidase
MESIMKQGCARPSYPPIVGSGGRCASVLHYEEDSGIMLAGDGGTIKPGIYIPEEKIGVRVEDTFMSRPKVS